MKRAQVAEAAVILDYDRIVARLEATERDAGVTVGSWRWAEARLWQLAIQTGLRRKVALRERAERLRVQ